MMPVIDHQSSLIRLITDQCYHLEKGFGYFIKRTLKPFALKGKYLSLKTVSPVSIPSGAAAVTSSCPPPVGLDEFTFSKGYIKTTSLSAGFSKKIFLDCVNSRVGQLTTSHS